MSLKYEPAWEPLPPREHERPGTNPDTGTAYHPTALPTVGPYALPVPGVVPGLPDCAQPGNTARQGVQPPDARGLFQNECFQKVSTFRKGSLSLVPAPVINGSKRSPDFFAVDLTLNPLIDGQIPD